METGYTRLTLDYTLTNDGWFVGQIRQIPAVLSQGRTLSELEENILDALMLLQEDSSENILTNIIFLEQFNKSDSAEKQSEAR